MSICGNMVGSYSQIGKTFVITDEAGNELTGVATENEVIFTATDNDVREGFVYAGDAGVSTGTKVIPTYHTSQGVVVIPIDSQLKIPVPSDLDLYDYTKFQAIVCSFNTNLNNSVAADKVSIDDSVYNVLSTDVLSTVSKVSDTKTVDLGITNDGEGMLIIRYFMYKEIE